MEICGKCLIHYGLNKLVAILQNTFFTAIRCWFPKRQARILSQISDAYMCVIVPKYVNHSGSCQNVLHFETNLIFFNLMQRPQFL